MANHMFEVRNVDTKTIEHVPLDSLDGAVRNEEIKKYMADRPFTESGELISIQTDAEGNTFGIVVRNDNTFGEYDLSDLRKV